ncbi:septum site-determining protein MinD [Allofrancisella guangzhouensis]|uniref:Septum site-determining protein MinD n=1 Tax=Allofrancisella guangzhouensis TaxID=594679 RepID=A0A0A8E2T2_9GAMM|nr:septum site-determining protein MinD [Allofrancisella guangzhouensis]AJC48264.1 cell division inhibitor MinD [Allofrancisella guangzhouensis]MBK2027508.1 septum site-determining protein MinD [Allofrancisella guangzhouensis]MBK2044383.1 septum site-determining protein MinD [Allofrancisella guangzhouensis]MBK2045431.1 septum site-determining protein MinD [Allofrancisella guangzhouensis]
MGEKKQGKVFVVTSGKGGVGKTTSSAAIAYAFAKRGLKTVVIDFDVGLRNLDLIMGCERRVVYDLINIVKEEATINQAIIKDKRIENLFIIPASQTRDKDALTEDGVDRVVEELKNSFDIILCDSPAGIEKGSLMAMRCADAAIIVTNPEVSSVRDSDRILGMLSSKTLKAQKEGEFKEIYLLLNRYDATRAKAGAMLKAEDVSEILYTPITGIIPESKDILEASNSGHPITHFADSVAAKAYFDAVDRMLGKDVPMRHTEHKVGFFKKLIGKS